MMYTVIVMVAFLVSTGVPTPFVEIVSDQSQCSNSFVLAYAKAKSTVMGEMFKPYIAWECFGVVDEPEQKPEDNPVEPLPKKDAI